MLSDSCQNEAELLQEAPVIRKKIENDQIALTQNVLLIIGRLKSIA